jgi:hypothetical protein
MQQYTPSMNDRAVTPRGSLLFGCGCNPGCSDITLDPPYTRRKTHSLFDMDDMDIPIYNWKQDTFMSENKNLRKSIGSKKQG